jgi:NTP pyrophosphatase (non-canonical NTP hydrolase)
MTLDEAQAKVDHWIKTIGVRYYGELTNLALLTEEVGELARIIARRYGEQSFKPGEESQDLSEEMADVLFVLICLANQTGVNLGTALEQSLEKKTLRDKDRHRDHLKGGSGV